MKKKNKNKKFIYFFSEDWKLTILLILIVLAIFSFIYADHKRRSISDFKIYNNSISNRSFSEISNETIITPPQPIKKDIEKKLSDDGNLVITDQYRYILTRKVPETMYIGLFNRFDHSLEIESSSKNFNINTKNVMFVRCNNKKINDIIYFELPKRIIIPPHKALSFKIRIISKEVVKNKISSICTFKVMINGKNYFEKEFEIIIKP